MSKEKRKQVHKRERISRQMDIQLEVILPLDAPIP
jgi:hypothetical protein